MSQAVAPAAIDWDAWRASYDTRGFADQQEFYTLVAKLHPCQESFNLDAISKAFDAIGGRNLNVTELGGWNGKLAASMLTRTDVKSWTNYDIVGVPQATSHPRYRLEVLTDYLWNLGPVDGDVFVACHTIEHLKMRELRQLCDVLRTEWVWLEAPLDNEPSDWTGYYGSHILECGWQGVNDMLTFRDKYRWVRPSLWRRT